MEAIVQSPRMMVASELNAWTVEPLIKRISWIKQ